MKFETYLQEQHAKSYSGTDDDMPEAFDHWLSQLDVSEVIEYAEKWGEGLAKEARELGQSEGANRL